MRGRRRCDRGPRRAAPRSRRRRSEPARVSRGCVARARGRLASRWRGGGAESHPRGGQPADRHVRTLRRRAVGGAEQPGPRRLRLGHRVQLWRRRGAAIARAARGLPADRHADRGRSRPAAPRRPRPRGRDGRRPSRRRRRRGRRWRGGRALDARDRPAVRLSDPERRTVPRRLDAVPGRECQPPVRGAARRRPQPRRPCLVFAAVQRQPRRIGLRGPVARAGEPAAAPGQPARRGGAVGRAHAVGRGGVGPNYHAGAFPQLRGCCFGQQQRLGVGVIGRPRRQRLGGPSSDLAVGEASPVAADRRSVRQRAARRHVGSEQRPQDPAGRGGCRWQSHRSRVDVHAASTAAPSASRAPRPAADNAGPTHGTTAAAAAFAAAALATASRAANTAGKPTHRAAAADVATALAASSAADDAGRGPDPIHCLQHDVHVHNVTQHPARPSTGRGGRRPAWRRRPPRCPEDAEPQRGRRERPSRPLGRPTTRRQRGRLLAHPGRHAGGARLAAARPRRRRVPDADRQRRQVRGRPHDARDRRNDRGRCQAAAARDRGAADRADPCRRRV